ncbi:MFS transporter [Salinivibrio kushneri]|uniref:MFS transporter n=1 Tax=Salinivibrio kushneri TaxID=1908198 RepID=UPI0022B3C06D|nr:MFS transporter [Salinivibrio kushneri]WBA12691.1 MFS transporter [Salinivibrio kushneri]
MVKLNDCWGMLMTKVNERNYALFAVTTVLVGLNLRPIMASVGPVLDLIQADTGVGDTSAGLLTTFPVLAMGVFAFFGGVLQRKFGVEKTVLWSLIALCTATLSRFYFHGEMALIATAVLGGTGIAVIQAVLPGMIKRDYGDKAGQLMALYTVGIMGGAMLSSSLTAPVSNLSSWPLSLSLWGILAIIALLSWKKISADSADSADSAGAGGQENAQLPLTSKRAWFLLLFFGIGTSAYTLVLAWLPPFYVQLGWSGTASGLLLGGVTLCQVIAAVSLSSVVDRFSDRRPILYSILGVIILGLMCLVVSPESLFIPALLLLGFGIGGLFPMSLIIIVDHLQAASQAGSLMGFVQGGGYVVASIMPFAAGVINDYFNDLSMAWVVMIVAMVVQLMMVPFLSPKYSLSTNDWSLQKAS